ncbi:hypothetical protein FHG87_022271 [Trinorchestia longiramus]|nr:hypothetical protein FHG87_022271 [Trinorchestia longiramus]
MLPSLPLPSLPECCHPCRCVEEDSGMRYLVGLDEECNMTVVNAMKDFLVYAWNKRQGEDSRMRYFVGLDEECNMTVMDAMKVFLVYAWNKRQGC